MADENTVRDLIDQICSRATSDEEARKLLERAHARDPRIEFLLLQHAKDNPEWLGRVLRLLAAVSNGQRLVSSLLPLMESEDTAVREMAALLIARGRTSVGWARDMMKHPEPRVRANVVEGVRPWSRDLELLEIAAQDPHHRVVCNAIVSMYALRPDKARLLLESQLAHPEWQFRAAATWACGAIGAQELDELVARMRKDPHPSVRWNALRAATSIHRNQVRPTGESEPDDDPTAMQPSAAVPAHGD